MSTKPAIIFDSKDRQILRELARQLGEHAAQPRYARLATEWLRHNRLRKGKPMVLVMPEGAWKEMVPDTDLRTGSPDTRELEGMLRRRIYHAEHLRDDTIIDDIVRVPLVHHWTGWGLEPRQHASPDADGAWAFDPVLLDYRDLGKLRIPELTIDQAATERNFMQMQELFGDILTVKRGTGIWPPVPALAHYLSQLRGLNELMIDVYEHPEGIHAYMQFMTDAACRLHDEVEAKGLVEINNGNSLLGTGGCTLTDELPAPGWQGKGRWCDCWCTAECQQFHPMSPQMLDEFVLPYQARIMERFGLTGYGCCEDLTRKFGVVKKRIPHLRRLSVAPWTDIRVAAAEIQDHYIYTRKPNPTLATVSFDRNAIRRDLQETLEVAKDCVVELVLNTVGTVMGHPERLEFWVDTAQELAAG